MSHASHRRENQAYVQIRAGSKMSRKCKICEAPIGHRCGSWRGFDKSIWVPIRTPHKER